MTFKKTQALLSKWYLENFRKLPWRMTQDPYLIWISEVMLQQTTVAAVLPYYLRFIEKFPTVTLLSHSSIEEVYKYWAGLGYYSRARNLHKSAQIIAQKGFPKTALQLLELPGFGPYISNAVASFAYNEPVGVLDGNVIRILSRKYGLKVPWWTTSGRRELQNLSHNLVRSGEPKIVNQAMMELGATVCTNANPLCFNCPWIKECLAYKNNIVKTLPLSKPKPPIILWRWEISILERNGKVAFLKNNPTPFLRNLPILPGKLSQVRTKPQKYDFIHTITKNKIYVEVTKDKSSEKNSPTALVWINKDQIKNTNPSSLIEKVLNQTRVDL